MLMRIASGRRTSFGSLAASAERPPGRPEDACILCGWSQRGKTAVCGRIFSSGMIAVWRSRCVLTASTSSSMVPDSSAIFRACTLLKLPERGSYESLRVGWKIVGSRELHHCLRHRPSARRSFGLGESSNASVGCAKGPHDNTLGDTDVYDSLCGGHRMLRLGGRSTLATASESLVRRHGGADRRGAPLFRITAARSNVETQTESSAPSERDIDRGSYVSESVFHYIALRTHFLRSNRCSAAYSEQWHEIRRLVGLPPYTGDNIRIICAHDLCRDRAVFWRNLQKIGVTDGSFWRSRARMVIVIVPLLCPRPLPL